MFEHIAKTFIVAACEANTYAGFSFSMSETFSLDVWHAPHTRKILGSIILPCSSQSAHGCGDIHASGKSPAQGTTPQYAQ